MFVVKEWSTVRVIPDPNKFSINNNYTFLMPGFDAKSFPFVIVCGKNSIRILNVSTFDIKSLVRGEMRTDKPGLRFAFAKGDQSEIEVHFAFTVQDKDGSGKNLN